MIKELKFLFYVIIIFLFIFFTFKYYFSNENKKNSYRSFEQNNDKIFNYSKKLILLKDDTIAIIEYTKQSTNKNKKNYNFWKLINIDE
jgi:hypothetical protein|tara:strand:- start:109 stop:372 length:264 start_codon:yes stop_codon:yes gene_type:complete